MKHNLGAKIVIDDASISKREVAKVQKIINAYPRKNHPFLSSLSIHNNLTQLQSSKIIKAT